MHTTSGDYRPAAAAEARSDFPEKRVWFPSTSPAKRCQNPVHQGIATHQPVTSLTLSVSNVSCWTCEQAQTLALGLRQLYGSRIVRCSPFSKTAGIELFGLSVRRLPHRVRAYTVSSSYICGKGTAWLA